MRLPKILVLIICRTAGLIPEPYFENNFLNSSLWNDNEWTYSKTFTMSEGALAAMRTGAMRKLLVFDGIKMGARVVVNGELLGEATDQFLRYSWPLDLAAHRLTASNTLQVIFSAAVVCD